MRLLRGDPRNDGEDARFSTAANWTPNGVPGNADNVTIVSATNSPVLHATDTINKLTITGGTLDLNGHDIRVQHQLTVSGTAMTQLRVTNGRIINRTDQGSSISHCKMDCILDLQPGSLTLTGVHATDSVLVLTSVNSTWKNNVFDGHVLVDKTTGNFWSGYQQPDTFRLGLRLRTLSTGTEATYLAHSSSGNYVGGDLTIELLPTATNYVSMWVGSSSDTTARMTVAGDVKVSSVGNTNTGIRLYGLKVNAGGHLKAGANGFKSGNLALIRCHLMATDTTRLLFGQAATVAITNSTIYGVLRTDSATVSLDGAKLLAGAVGRPTGSNGFSSANSKFHGPVDIVNGANIFANRAYAPVRFTVGNRALITRNNRFNDSLTVINNYNNGGALLLGYLGPDTLAHTLIKNTTASTVNMNLSNSTVIYGNLTLKATSTGGIGVGNGLRLQGNLLLDTGGAPVALGSNIQHSGGGVSIGPNGYTNSTLTFNSYKHSGSGNIDLTGAGSGTNVTFTNSCTVGGALTATGVASATLSGSRFDGGATVSAGSLSVVNNRFYGTTALTKTGTATNYNYGNGFHGATTLTQASNAGALYWAQYGRDTSFAALTLNCSGSQPHTLANGTDFIVLGNLTVDRSGSGALTLGAGNLLGKVRFEGGNAQTFTSTGSSAALAYKAMVNKSAGALTLASDLEVNNDITLTNGIIKTTGSAVLKLRDNVTVTGASDASHIEGKVLKVGNDAFTFPVGRNGAYRPIAISAPSSITAEFRAEYFEKSADPIYSLSSRDTTLHGISANEYWTLERLVSSNNVSVTVKWDTLTSCTMTAPTSDVRVAGWHTGTAKWKDLGNSATTGNIVEGTVTSGAAVSSFSAFTVGHRWEEMGCRHAELTWEPDTLLIDSLSHFYVAASGLPSGYSTSLWIEGGGYYNGMTYHDLALLDTIRTSIHLNDSTGLLKATLYFVNANGHYVDSLNYLIPYKKISGGSGNQCEASPAECEYIVNGNFAGSIGYPNGLGEIGLVNRWNKIIVDDYCERIDEYCLDWNGTTDFFHVNATNSDAAVPLNYLTTIPVNSLNLNTTDDSYVGILSWLPYANNVYVTEYLTQELPTALTVGATYRLRMHVQLSNRSTHATRVGALFTEDMVCHTSNVGPILPNQLGQPFQLMDSEPDPGTGYLYDFDEWHVVDFTFVAQENWKHLTIGQFTPGNNATVNGGLWQTTGAVPLIGGPGGPTVPVTQSYWFIDEVSLVPSHSCCILPENVSYDDDELTTTTGNVTTLTGQVTVSGILNLSGGGEFVFDNANVIMEPNAQINVNANTTLTITNNTRIHSCTEMWNMINVTPTAEIVVNNGALIEDALTGIYIDNNSTYSIDQATLNKNYIHIHRPTSFGGPTSNGTITNSRFLCQTTESLWLGGTAVHTNLLVPHLNEQTYIGIANYANVIAGQPNSNTLTVGGIGQGNLFDHARYGIYTLGNLVSNGNTFTNMWLSPSLSDFNEGSGIYSRNANNLSVLNDNLFDHCLTGVNSWANTNVNIRGNTFKTDVTGIRVREPRISKVVTINDNVMSGTTNGIWCQNNTGATITIGTPTQPNELNISSSVTPAYPTYIMMGSGIFVEELTYNPATHIRTESNRVNDAYHGIHYRNMLFINTDIFSGIYSNTVYVHDGPYGGTFPYGNPFGIRADVRRHIVIHNNYITPMATTNWNKSGIVVSASIDAQVSCNTMEGILIGLQYQGSAYNNRAIRNLWLDAYYGLVYNTGIAQNMGAVGHPLDNKWTNVYLFDTYAFNSIANNATIYYRSAGGDYYPESNGSNINQSFAFDHLATSGTFTEFDCDENGTIGLAPLGEVRAMMHSALTDTATLPLYEEELRWQQKQQMYEQILDRDSIALGDSLLTVFFDSCQVSNMGILDRAMKARTELNKPETLAVYLDTLSSMTTAILPESALRDVLIVLLQKDLDTTTVVDSASWRMDEVLNALFPDSSFVAARTKNVSYNHIQVSTLHYIAQQCPMEFGRAVFLARTALGLNDTVPYTGVHECEIMNLPTSERRGDENQETETVRELLSTYSATVHPNPAQDHLSIEVVDFEEANWRIELLSSLGQKVADRNLQLGKNQIDVTELRSGIYYWRIFRRNEQVISDKLIITK